MDRRLKLALGVVVLLCLVGHISGGRAATPPSTLKKELIGTWEITSVSNQYDDGKKSVPFGAGVTGRYVFGSDGLFSETIIGEPSADLKTNDPRRPDALVVVNLGHYTADEAKKTITYKIDHAAFSARNGSERSLIANVNGDAASFVTPNLKDQIGTFAFTAEVKRIK